MLSVALALTLSVAPPTGRWEGNGFTLVLEGSGSGSISMGPSVPPEPITWKLSGNALLITQGGDTIPYSVTLAKDSMTLTAAVLEAPLTLRRTGSANSKGAKQPVLPQPPPPQQQPQQEPMRPVKEPQVQGPPPGTCEAACVHYTKCARLSGQDQLAACVINCYASGANPYQLASYLQLPCDQAIAVVVAAQLQALQAAQGAQQGNRRGGNNKGSRCNGCVRDGNDCVWISQSNWGTGTNSPYSGAVSSCDADCCQ